MTLADHVRVRRRFQRSIRIDTDLSDPDALNGFICPQSSADVLETMARHIKETDQAAFTWTGAVRHWQVKLGDSPERSAERKAGGPRGCRGHSWRTDCRRNLGRLATA